MYSDPLYSYNSPYDLRAAGNKSDQRSHEMLKHAMLRN